MAEYHVRISALESSVSSLNAQLEQFESLTAEANRAAEELASMWKGDASDAFRQEQQERARLYLEMQRAVRDLIGMVKSIAARYQSTDVQCMQMLKK